MTAWLPSEYVTLRRAGTRIEDALSDDSGVPVPRGTALPRWLSWTQRVRQKEAIAAFWKSNDRGQIRLFGFNDREGRPTEIPVAASQEVPFLRRPTVCSLAYLRPNDPLHPWFVARFGSDLSRVVLAVREDELEKLARSLNVKRRKGAGRRRGHPGFYESVAPIIRETIETGRWSTLEPLGALTKIVCEKARTVSSDTVSRVLNQLYEETGDEHYKRPRRKTRGNRH